MNRCINKIETSQDIIDSFLKNFLKNENAYDPYQVGALLRTLDSFLNQIAKTSAVLSKTEFNKISPFLKDFKMEYTSGKSTSLRKDVTEFLTWKFCLPFWKDYVICDSNIETFGDCYYTTFKKGLYRCLNTLISPIFNGLAKMHGIQIIEKLTVDLEANTSVTPKSLTDKISQIIDFNQDIIAGITVEEPAVLVKRQVKDEYIIKGYTCQIDAITFNFTTNRLIGDQLSKHLK